MSGFKAVLTSQSKFRQVLDILTLLATALLFSFITLLATKTIFDAAFFEFGLNYQTKSSQGTLGNSDAVSENEFTVKQIVGAISNEPVIDAETNIASSDLKHSHIWIVPKEDFSKLFSKPEISSFIDHNTAKELRIAVGDEAIIMDSTNSELTCRVRVDEISSVYSDAKTLPPPGFIAIDDSKCEVFSNIDGNQIIFNSPHGATKLQHILTHLTTYLEITPVFILLTVFGFLLCLFGILRTQKLFLSSAKNTLTDLHALGASIKYLKQSCALVILPKLLISFVLASFVSAKLLENIAQIYVHNIQIILIAILITVFSLVILSLMLEKSLKNLIFKGV